MGQKIVVYTDHKNLIYDALGSTSNRMYRWRLILEEYGSEIIYIKGIHNTVDDAISGLEFSLIENPSLNTDKKNWMILTQIWCAIEQLGQPENGQNMGQTMCLQTTVTKRKYIL